VKTFYTGERFREIVDATPVPVLALGSKKLPREIDALGLAAEAIGNGARGVVFGRNLIQAREPERFLDALLAVVKTGVAPDAAATRHGIA
jgi:DhnA family fructose-bisphosphate aldolase class Ia